MVKSMRLEHAAFAAMTLAVLWFSDAFYLYASLPVARLWSVACVAVLMLIAIYLHRKRNISFFDNGYMQWLTLYTALILLIGFIHTAALLSVPDDMLVNAEGISAARTLHRNFGFLFFSLCFPAFIYIFYVLLHHLDIKTIIRWVAVAISISCLILYYQVFIDPEFFHLNEGYFHRWKFDGLSFQPNDLSLALFLSLPLLIIGIALEGKWIRLAYLIAIPVIMGALHFTGSRSTLGGAIVFIFALPVLIGLLQKHWNRTTRVLWVTLPFISLLFIAIGLSTGLIAFQMETGMNRLLAAMQDFQVGGINAIFGHSYRGYQTAIATNLIMDAPFGGWGPGGFFREQSNAVFHSAGLTEKTIETALNYYLNIAGDFGIPLLMLLMLLLLWPIRLGIQACRQCPDHKQRMVLGILALGNSIFMLVIFTMPPTFMLEPFWLWTLLIVLLLVFASKHRKGDFQGRINKPNVWLVAVLFITVAGGAWQTAFGDQGYAARQHASWWNNSYEKNCFPERNVQNEPVRLCESESYLRIWLPENSANNIIRQVVSVPKNTTGKTLSLAYKTKHGKTQRLQLTANDAIPITFIADAEDIRHASMRNGLTRSYITLFMTLSVADGSNYKVDSSGLHVLIKPAN